MLKCNTGRVYENELCVQGERILAKTAHQVDHNKPKHHQQQQRVKVVSRREQPTRGCDRKTLHLNIVENFNEQVCGDFLKTIRNSVEVEDFKRFLQTAVVVNNNDDLNRKYSTIYHEFFGVHYEHLKSLITE